MIRRGDVLIISACVDRPADTSIDSSSLRTLRPTYDACVEERPLESRILQGNSHVFIGSKADTADLLDSGFRPSPPALRARTRLQHRLAEQLAPQVQDQRHPQRLPEQRRDMRPELRPLGGAGDHRHRRGQGEDRGGQPCGRIGSADRDGRRSRRSAPGPWSPASTGSAPRARSRPGRRCRGTPRRAANSSSRNRASPAPGRPASRPPAAAGAARPPACEDVDQQRAGADPHHDAEQRRGEHREQFADEQTHRSAPRRRCTSMILFDFSSISCDSTMPDSRMVRKNSIIWPTCAVSARSLASEPGGASACWLDVQLRNRRFPGRGALSQDQQASWRDGRVAVGWTSPASRGSPSPPASTARTGGSGAGEQPLLLRRQVGFGRDIATAGRARLLADRLREPLPRRGRARRTRRADRPPRPPAARPRSQRARRWCRTRRRAAAGTAGPSRKKMKVFDSTVAVKSRRAMTKAERRRRIMPLAPPSPIAAAAASPAMATNASCSPGRSIASVSIPAPPSISALSNGSGPPFGQLEHPFAALAPRAGRDRRAPRAVLGAGAQPDDRPQPAARLVDRAFERDLAAGDDRDPLAQPLGMGDDVGREDDRRAVSGLRRGSAPRAAPG